MANRIQLRRGTAAQWTASNPVLAQGEPGIETDTGKQKFGNGTSAWSSLPYSSAGPQGAPGAAGVADDASVKSLITTPGSQTAAALTATIASSGAGNFLAAASVLSGAILSIYGHSYPPIPGFYCTPGKEWPTLLAARFGMTQHNYGESGARMIEMATAAISTKLPGNTVADRHYAPGTPASSSSNVNRMTRCSGRAPLRASLVSSTPCVHSLQPSPPPSASPPARRPSSPQRGRRTTPRRRPAGTCSTLSLTG